MAPLTRFSTERIFAINRRSILGILVLSGLLLLSFSSGAVAQEEENKKSINQHTLQTGDGWPIHITYYKSSEGKETPVVVFLHRKGGNRLVWKGEDGLAQSLWDRGYAVISVDLRKHGQSKPTMGGGAQKRRRRRSGDATDLRPADYHAMVAQDLEAVKRFIFEEHQKQHLNMRKMAIVAPEMSAPIAIYYAVHDWSKKPYPDASTFAARTPRGQDVRALVLVSPMANLRTMPTAKHLLNLRDPRKNIAFLICVGSQDSIDRGQARGMYRKLTSIRMNKNRMYYEEYNSKLRGSDLLRQSQKAQQHLAVFLKKHLKELPDKWRDRKSRLD